jgi:hypothetical protein
MLMASPIWPATEKFNTSVRDGLLDYTLIQPQTARFDQLFALFKCVDSSWRSSYLWEFR